MVVPPAELGLGFEPMLRISVFMNVFDCHINRAPMRGQVSEIQYRAGEFVNAELDKASEDNERNGLVIETSHGKIGRSEEHTSELQSLMRNSYAVFGLKKKKKVRK